MPNTRCDGLQHTNLDIMTHNFPYASKLTTTSRQVRICKNIIIPITPQALVLIIGDDGHHFIRSIIYHYEH